MPSEMIKEFIGKDCIITLISDSAIISGTIVSIEDNWIKVDEKKKVKK